MDETTDVLELLPDEVLDKLPGNAVERIEDGAAVDFTIGMEDTTAIFSSRQLVPVGQTGNRVATVTIAEPPVSETYRVRMGRETQLFEDQDTGPVEGEDYILIWVEELEDGTHRCPKCRCPFDTEAWIETGGYGDRAGSTTFYECPGSDCDGEARVLV